MDAGASGRTARCAQLWQPQCHESHRACCLNFGSNGPDARPVGGVEGVYDDGPRSDCALPHFVCARRFRQHFPVFANQRRVTRG